MRIFIISVIKRLIFWNLIIQFLDYRKVKNTNKLQLTKRKTIVESVLDESFIDRLSLEDKEHWIPRIALVQACSDNQLIEIKDDAGIFNEAYYFVMHNGVLIEPLSYYGLPMLYLLTKNKSIHEPQEEFAFQEVLKLIPESSVMIELGAYWSFYSMWFNQKVRNAKNYMIEPENIFSGKRNFDINNLQGDFTQAYISDVSNYDKTISHTPTICIDDFIQEKNIDFVDILHSDIQGYEFLMLQGAKDLIANFKVGYIFISIHSNELHNQCSSFLEHYGYTLVCSSDLDESYSWDGLIVYKNPHYVGVEKVEIAKRNSIEVGL